VRCDCHTHAAKRDCRHVEFAVRKCAVPRPPFRANGLDDRHRALIKFVAVGTPVNVDELAPPIVLVATSSSSSASSSSTAGAATGGRIEPNNADEHFGEGGFDEDVDRADDEVVDDAERDQLLLAAAKLVLGSFSTRELCAVGARASPASPSKMRRVLGMQAGSNNKGLQARRSK